MGTVIRENACQRGIRGTANRSECCRGDEEPQIGGGYLIVIQLTSCHPLTNR